MSPHLDRERPDKGHRPFCTLLNFAGVFTGQTSPAAPRTREGETPRGKPSLVQSTKTKQGNCRFLTSTSY